MEVTKENLVKITSQLDDVEVGSINEKLLYSGMIQPFHYTCLDNYSSPFYAFGTDKYYIFIDEVIDTWESLTDEELDEKLNELNSLPETYVMGRRGKRGGTSTGR